MKQEKYDLIIIGTGPAGLMAAVYAARYKLKTLVLGKLPGGLIGEAHEICNFPTYNKISGFELVQKMIKQVQNLNINIKQEFVENISGKDNEFLIKTSKQEYQTKKIILGTGSERKKLNIEREKELTGKGVSYCATCDAGFYSDKIVGVVGGSDAALTASLLLTKFAKKVYIIYRKNKFFRAEPTWIEEVEKNEKITPLFNSEIQELLGKDKLGAVKILNTRENTEKEIKVDGLFIEIGSSPQIELAKILNIDLNENNYIKTNKEQKTSVKGIYAAGDITDNFFKQAITAASEGAIAAHSVYEEISKEK